MDKEAEIIEEKAFLAKQYVGACEVSIHPGMIELSFLSSALELTAERLEKAAGYHKHESVSHPPKIT